MKNTMLFLVIGMILILGSLTQAHAATQTFNIVVASITEISVSGAPGTLTVSTATAGSEPTDATDETTSYSITTNGANKKITGQITTGGLPPPSGIDLKILLDATDVGTGAGTVTLLAASASDLVTAITKKTASAKSITYTLSATTAAGELTSTSKTVTLTVSAG